MRTNFGAVLLACLVGCSESAPATPSADPSDASPGAPADSWGPLEPALAEKFQAALEAARAEQDLPGLGMAVAYRDSRQLWVSSTGFSNLTTQAPWQPTNESRIGSVTKTFTAAIMMQLVEEGMVSLDDAIETWVPGWYAGPTLRQLLGNASGIASYNYVGSFDYSRPWTPDELVQWAYDNEPNLHFVPGTQWEYSNTNFVLLGMVIEAATGQPYGDVLRSRLLEPLNLESMRLALSGDDSPELVRCYTGSPPVDSSDAEDPSYGWSAGGIVSTPTDLARWIVALYGGELLSDASLTSMTTPNGTTTPDQEDYGLGTVIENGDAENTLVGHTGGLSGYQTHAYYLVEQDVALVLMSSWRETDLRAASAHGWAAVLGIPYP